MDLLLSITVSLPTSIRPICFGSIPYFSRREVTAVKLKVQNKKGKSKNEYRGLHKMLLQINSSLKNTDAHTKPWTKSGKKRFIRSAQHIETSRIKSKITTSSRWHLQFPCKMPSNLVQVLLCISPYLHHHEPPRLPVLHQSKEQ